MLRGLAQAGADVVMHGLVDAQELKDKVDQIKSEFGVKVGHSAADVRKPHEIRQVSVYVQRGLNLQEQAFQRLRCPLLPWNCIAKYSLSPHDRDMVRGAQEEFGKLDILVNNVGIQFVSPVEDFPEERWDAIMDICLNSTFHATKAALPQMLQNGWGRIINTGSMHALVASPYKSAYNAAKHGVVRTVTSPRAGICGAACSYSQGCSREG